MQEQRNELRRKSVDTNRVVRRSKSIERKSRSFAKIGNAGAVERVAKRC